MAKKQTCCSCNAQTQNKPIVKQCGLLGIKVLQTKINTGCKCFGCLGVSCDTCPELKILNYKSILALCHVCEKAR